jgi:hypothetical protein
MAAQPAGNGLLPRVVLLVGVLFFLTGPLLRPLAHPYAYSDFVTYYSAARAFAAHADAYDDTALRAHGAPAFDGWIGRYFYPPPFAAVVVRPLGLIPFAWSRRLWVLCEAVTYAAGMLLFGRLLLHRMPAWRTTVVALLGAVYAPMALDLKLGSVSGLLLLFCALFFRARQRGRFWQAGFALAAAVLLKVSPALLLGYLMLRGEWRLVGRVAAAGVLLVAVCLPFTGVHPYVVYFTRVVPFLAGANFSWFTNQSVDAFFWRLLVPNPDTTPWLAAPLLQRAATAIVNGTLLAGLVVVAWRGRRASAFAFAPLAWEMALALVTALLVARVTWEYMLVLALPCFILWAGALWNEAVGRRTALAVGLAYALCALPFPYTEAPARAGAGLLCEAPRTYGLLLLYVLTWLRLVRPPTVLEAAGPAVPAPGSASVPSA